MTETPRTPDESAPASTPDDRPTAPLGQPVPAQPEPARPAPAQPDPTGQPWSAAQSAPVAQPRPVGQPTPSRRPTPVGAVVAAVIGGVMLLGLVFAGGFAAGYVVGDRSDDGWRGMGDWIDPGMMDGDRDRDGRPDRDERGPGRG